MLRVHVYLIVLHLIATCSLVVHCDNQLPPAFQKSTNGPFSIYSLLNDQLAEESQDAFIRQILAPNFDLAALPSELTDEATLLATQNTSSSDQNVAHLDPMSTPLGRGMVNGTQWPFMGQFGAKTHGPMAVTEPPMVHTNPYEQYMPQLTAFQRQSNPMKQQDILKLSAAQANDHVHDILQRFRQNYNQTNQQINIKQNIMKQQLAQLEATAAPTSSTVSVDTNDKFDENVESENDQENFDDHAGEQQNVNSNLNSNQMMDMQHTMTKEKVTSRKGE